MRLPFDGSIRVTKLYGTPPPSGLTYAAGKHSGLDLVGVDSKKIYAITGGSVIRSKYDKTGWGNYVVVRQQDGLYCIYAHLLERKVAVGEKVAEGQWIGVEGATGNVTGSHLHLELRKDYADKYSTENPATYLGIKEQLGGVKMADNKKDVSEWAKEAQAWVKNHNISDGSNPKENCTREEVWVMLQNLFYYWETALKK